MTRCSGWFARGLRPLSGLLLLFCLLGWMPAAWADPLTCSRDQTFSLPNFGNISVSANVQAGTPIGPQKMVTISFICKNIPNGTISIVASDFGGVDYVTTNAIMLKTSVTGIDLQLTANPTPTYDQASGTVTFAKAIPAPNGSSQEIVYGQLVTTQVGPFAAGPLTSLGGGALIGKFEDVPSGGGGGRANLNSTLVLADGTTINAPTCTVNAAPAPVAIAVLLPTVSTSALPSGKTAGTTGFSIALSGCSNGVTKARIYFVPGAAIDATTGNLINISGTAANVQVQLLNGAGSIDASAGSAINLGAAKAAQNSGQYTVTGGAATMNYYARYVANGAAAGAGSVITSVDFTLDYP